MTLKIIGAVLIVTVSGGFGLRLAAEHKHKEQILEDLYAVLEYMASELEYHLTPLPTLCRQAARECTSMLSDVLGAFAQELDNQVSPDAGRCMASAISGFQLPAVASELLMLLGKSFGKFDINGQLRGISGVKQHCNEKLTSLKRNRDNRLRGYQTLALCAGAALVILFI